MSSADFWENLKLPAPTWRTRLRKLLGHNLHPDEESRSWLMLPGDEVSNKSIPLTPMEQGAQARKLTREIMVTPEMWKQILELRKCPTSLTIPLPRDVVLTSRDRRRLVIHVQRLLTGYYKPTGTDPHNKQGNANLSKPMGTTIATIS